MFKVFQCLMTLAVFCVSQNNAAILDFEFNSEGYKELFHGHQKKCEDYIQEKGFSDYQMIE